MTASTSGKIGIDYTRHFKTQLDVDQPEFALGTRDSGEDGTVWVYVKASAAIAAYDVVAIDEDNFATPLTKALADAGHRIGFAQVAFASGEYGWVALSGSNISARVKASCAADINLYTTATAGCLDDAPTSQSRIDGLVLAVAAAAGASSAVEVIANFPHVENI